MDETKRKYYREYQKAYRERNRERAKAYQKTQRETIRLLQPKLQKDNEWLYLVRTRLDLTQVEIADMAGVCPSLVSRWEHGTAHLLPKHRKVIARKLREKHDVDKEVQDSAIILEALKRADL